MSPRPARRAAEAPRLDPACPRNDDCQRQMAEATSRLADHFDALFGPPGADPEDEGWLTKVLKAIGAVFARWDSMCTWARTKKPWWWVLGLAWLVSNFMSPELKGAVQNGLAVMVNNYFAGGGG